MLLKIVLGIIAFGVLMANVLIMDRLRRYRTDLKTGQGVTEGRSAIAEINIFSSGNYSEPGKKLLRWLWAAQGLLFITWLAFVGLFVAT